MIRRRKPVEVDLESGPDLAELAEEVNRDKRPRLIKRNGQVLVAVVAVDGWPVLGPVSHTREQIERAIATAGAWADLDTDAMIEEIYRARHEAPPRPPVEL